MNWDYFMVWLAARANSKKKGVRHHPMDACLNCENSLEKEQLFCQVCGQKVHNSKLTVWSLLGEFFGSLFNLDNGIYRSIVALPVPGFLSKQFMSGKRKSYLNPIRMFLITLIIHLAVLSNLIPIEEVNRTSAQYLESIGQSKLKTEYFTYKDSIAAIVDGCDLDTIETMIFGHMDLDEDSIQVIGPNVNSSSQAINDFAEKTKFDRGDMYTMPTEEFLETYNAENYFERVAMTQMLRAVRDPSGAIRFGIGNILWSVLFSIIFTGLFMKLLYIRRKRYYVEHLIVLFNIHSFAFLLASLGLYIGSSIYGWDDNPIDDIAYSIIALFFFLSMKFYYQQGWFKSFVKFFIVSWIYFFLLLLMILMVTIVSLFFFK